MNSKFNFQEYDRKVYEYILDNIPDAITIIDKNYKTMFFNKTAEEYYEVSREEIIGKDLRDFFPNSLLPKVIDSETPYHNIYNSPRENSYTVISAVPLYNKDDELIGGLARDRDITEYVKLSELVKKAQINLEQLEREYSKVALGESYFSNILSSNTAFIKTINLCKNIAKTPINVLLYGESGTGKELFAKAIHYESGRKGNFVAINCSAIPVELFESELFGYEYGAFTGAKKEGKSGKFEEANGGTLFLDEIGDMPINLQPKLLRALEEGSVTRVGGNKQKKLDIRIVSATNRNIKRLIKEGKFRKDLYYRLDTFQVNLLPLRNRKEDIILLANRFLQQYCMENGINIIQIPQNILNILKNYSWEGNVRELRNVIQRAVILARENNKNQIEKEHLPTYLQNIIINKQKYVDNDIQLNTEIGLESTIEEIEKQIIKEALEKTNFKKTDTAKLLKIPRTTLYYKIEKYGLKNRND